jgi:hypothetical protein
MRCFNGGGLGLFLGNTLGDEDTKVGKEVNYYEKGTSDVSTYSYSAFCSF